MTGVTFTRRGALMAGLAAGLGGTSVAAAPKAKLIDARWRQTGAGGDPDYGPWAQFLSAYIRPGADGVTRVAYGQAVQDGGAKALRIWLGQTQQTDPASLAPDAQRAWWINLYNAATVDLVLSEYPVDTIKEVNGGLFNTGPWTDKVLTVNGQALSLDDVEHGILRPIWPDARIHYAVNCASIGCPNLKPTPWTAAGLEADLNAGAAAYVNDPRGAEVRGGELTASKIYDWFQEDFGGGEAGVIAHLRQYASSDLAADLASVNDVDGYRYDWSLNGA